MAVHYARRLADMKIDGLEVSCGTSSLSPWNMCMGDVPLKEILKKYDESARPNVEDHSKKNGGKIRTHRGIQS